MNIFTYKNHVIAGMRNENTIHIHEAMRLFGYVAHQNSLDPDIDPLCRTLRALLNSLNRRTQTGIDFLADYLRPYGTHVPIAWVRTQRNTYLVASREWLVSIYPLFEDSNLLKQMDTYLIACGPGWDLHRQWYLELTALCAYAQTGTKRAYDTGYLGYVDIPQKTALREFPKWVMDLIGFTVEPPDPWAKHNQGLIRLFSFMSGASERLVRRIVNG